MVLLVDLVVEERLLQVKAQRDRAHDEGVQLVARLEELEHRLTEAGRGALLRPAVLPRLVPVAADLHGLLEVGRLGAQLGDLVRVGGLCDALAPDAYVAAVRAGVFPGKLVLRRDKRGPRPTTMWVLTFTSVESLKNSALWETVSVRAAYDGTEGRDGPFGKCV